MIYLTTYQEQAAVPLVGYFSIGNISSVCQSDQNLNFARAIPVSFGLHKRTIIMIIYNDYNTTNVIL